MCYHPFSDLECERFLLFDEDDETENRNIYLCWRKYGKN